MFDVEQRLSAHKAMCDATQIQIEQRGQIGLLFNQKATFIMAPFV